MATAQDQRKVELDFDGIKTNIINYYKTQTNFKDYNYTGSNLQVLMNNLAYNTHYMGLYASLSVNERFLDSAVSRSAVVSSAKMLGYVPHSRTSARAWVNITVSNFSSPPTVLTLPRLSNFSSLVPSADGNTSTFHNLDAYIATRNGNTFTFSGVPIYEGKSLTFRYIHSGEVYSAYEIPNDNVDKSTVRIRVQNSLSDLTTANFVNSDTIINLDGNSQVFFISENYRGKYEVRFGDNVVGKNLTNGNVVIIEYLVSAGASANSLKTFTLNNIFSDANVTVTLNTTYSTASIGGSDGESIESVKNNAPLHYQRQDRLVTAGDFQSVLEEISYIDSVTTWGGEDNVPPVYGKVFISVKPTNETILSDSAKTDIIKTFLKPKKVLSIVPTFVDPDYTYVSTRVTVKYNTEMTDKSTSEMSNLVRSAVNSYQTTNIGKFGKSFYHDVFISKIADIDPSVVSCYAVVNVQKRVTPFVGSNESFQLYMGVGIRPNSFVSTKFYIYIDGTRRLVSFRDYPNDNPPSNSGTGVLQLWDADSKVVYKSYVGTVNYYTGYIDSDSLVIDDLPTGINTINFTTGMQETQYDIDVKNNNIILIDDSNTNIVTGEKVGVSVEVIQL